MNRTLSKAIKASIVIHLGIFILAWALTPDEPKKDDRVYVQLLSASIQADTPPAESSQKVVETPKPKPEPAPVKPAPKPQPKPEPVIKPAPKPEPKPEPVIKPVPKPEPKPVIKPVPKPEPKPKQKPVIKPAPKPEPKPEPVIKPAPQPKPKPVIRKVTTRNPETAPVRKVTRPTTTTSDLERKRREALDRMKNMGSTLNRKASTPAKVEWSPEQTGGSNYAALVTRKVQEKWNPVLSEAHLGSEVKVELVIDRSGRITSKKIVRRSGNSVVDAAAQTTLNKLRFIAPFPKGDTTPSREFRVTLQVGY